MSRWLAFSQVEAMPDSQWGDAMVAHTFASVMGGFKGGIDAFIPTPEAKAMTHSQLKAKLIIGLRARKADDGQAGEG